jgi:hypothetical protein
MAIPGPGPAISIQTIVNEFGGTVPHSLTEYYRGGGLVPNVPQNNAIPTSGTIAIGNFYGASNRNVVNLVISGNTYNYDVFANRSPSYIAGNTDLTVTINPGVAVGSTSPGAYAMLVPSEFSPADSVTIINNGTVIGTGGTGGNGNAGSNATAATAGTSGGNGVYVNRPVTILNNGTIAGGGGGGGGGGGVSFPNPPKIPPRNSGGGGGGGGAGFNAGGGGIGGSSARAPAPSTPGSPGTLTDGGAGGAGALSSPTNAGPGGTGGGQGAAGAGGVTVSAPRVAGGGGAGGFYIVGNPFVTWSTTGNRFGGVA